MNSLTPTQMPINNPTSNPTCERTKYAFAAESLLSTVDIDMHNIRNWAILDSGATSNFLVTNAPVEDIVEATKGLHVKLPNGDKVTSTHTCNLKLPLPNASRLGHIIPGLD